VCWWRLRQVVELPPALQRYFILSPISLSGTGCRADAALLSAAILSAPEISKTLPAQGPPGTRIWRVLV